MATATRSIASLTLSFGLVNVPVRLFSATESGSEIRFNMLAKDGSRLKQQYVNERTKAVVERKDMVKGYEVEDNQFVLFTPEELKQLEEGSSHVIEIVSFVPLESIDPLFYDKSYLLAPDKRGEKPYALLAEALRQSGRCALAKWAWKTKQYVAQVRANDDGLILQQLRYAAEVRSLADLDIPKAPVSKPELQLALQLVDQIAADSFDPTLFRDEEKERVLAAIEEKVKGRKIVASSREEPGATGGGQVIDLMDALRASLGSKPAAKPKAEKPSAKVTALPARKNAKRAVAEPEAAPAKRARAQK
ncbi:MULTISPECIES: Ku protein [unclassified Roseateles]|uniref:non-homologous end joining protein Ku n=1 Tax=unclassified Roseateles TaxID=2626991 RepID=UPI0006F40CCC|nr:MULTISPECIES: Ku protein [unclassified Roseateles]KQW52039.1 DNA repair protein [Pelomonas sp. Root405]KRA78273.1 DNA repair protein [Pelomonas sp. Root662]